MENFNFIASFFFFFLTFLCSHSKISSATDFITRNESITDGQTLVSSNQVFELGFFSPPNSTNRYVGIWFKNITKNLTVVWVANRNDPLPNLSGTLTISNNGNILIQNGSSNRVTWSSNLSISSVQNPVAQLLNTGNFVIRDGINSERYLYQSFDHPCDTLLLGGKEMWNLNVSHRGYLTSWKSLSDPGIGDFSYGIELLALPQLVIRNRSIKKFRSGPWNGLSFTGLPYFWSNPVFRPSFSSNIPSEDDSVYKRIVLNQSGVLQRFTIKNEMQDWTVLFSVPNDDCDNYGHCGANSICNITKTPVCECLQGFRPKSPEDWKKLNWFDGCVKRSELSCGKGDMFLPMQRVKLPDTSRVWINAVMRLDECKRECLKNCSCAAYANSDYSEGGSGCVLWFGDLIDIRQVSDNGVQDLYIRLAAIDIGNNIGKKQRPMAMIVILSVALPMLLVSVISWCAVRKMRRKGRGEESQEEDLELPLFDWISISTATNTFSYKNKIGEGGFGPVYKGKLVDGQEIAVKRLSRDSGQGLNEFKNEVRLISKLQHRNLVKLLGCCIQAEERLLIYEYMPNKSLDYFIFDKDRSKILAWPKLFDIVMGIARGLLYLHQDSRLRIVHRDFKTSNILLDGDLNPKIGDFGMARIFGGDQNEVITERVVGTYGYMAPEYALDGRFSTKSDVFSFGIVVLEMVSGKKNRGFANVDDHPNLIEHAWMLWQEGKPSEIMDSSLKDSHVLSEVLRCIQVGLLCVERLPDDRPGMSSVVSMLTSETASSLPQPKQPGYFAETSPSTDRSNKESHSKYMLSITLLQGR